jgi:hypothetical protein
VTADEQLLAAALLSGDRARRAWAQWSAHADLDAVDDTRHALLPQLYRNLASLGVDDPLVERLAGVYRHTWVHNQLLLRRTAPALAALRGAGVEALLTGPVALALTVYPDVGARPVHAPELLVPPRSAGRALRVLRGEGWSAVAGPVRRRIPARVRSAATVVDRDGTPLVLRWRAPVPQGALRAGAVEVRVHDVPASVPPLGALLAHCRALARSDLLARADLIAVTRRAGPEDWDLARRIEKGRRPSPSLAT